ncbi:MAG TPA: inositol monophosphatase family protein [Candidatus Limnocylindria bacterium]|nr:inositol monophosphatase family protein [Candidatus Limnocylindria bacterium]
MKSSEQKRALDVAVKAARAAGGLMKKNFHEPKKVNEMAQYDIKLELDVKCQELIEKKLAAAFPKISVLGEEGDSGDAASEYRWVIDPIDGTVNFAYGIPHACASIALQEKGEVKKSKTNGRHSVTTDGYSTLLGVVYDPFVDELWTATHGGKAFLNDRVINVSKRATLAEAVVGIGFSKRTDTLTQMLPTMNRLIHRVRKVRMMGAAALSLTYSACGRHDAYLEAGVRLWDIAAGGLIVECAGGEFFHEPMPGEPHAYRLIVNNGLLRKQLTALM